MFAGIREPGDLSAVCLLVRRVTTAEDRPRLSIASSHPDIKIGTEDSYVRVGFVRGAGSHKAWQEVVPHKMANLL
jgi:hypothetical protein